MLRRTGVLTMSRMPDAKAPSAVRPGDRRAARSSTRSASSTRGSMIANPVMFVVEVGSVLTTVLLAARPRRPAADGAVGVHRARSSLWLWFTVLFANFAEAMAEGRGKAQADTLRRDADRDRWPSSLRRADGDVRDGAGADARARATSSLVEAGDVIPADGEVIEGVASVDESAITGESAPVIREIGRRPLGGHRRHAGAVRLDRGADHRRTRARRSSTA